MKKSIEDKRNYSLIFNNMNEIVSNDEFNTIKVTIDEGNLIDSDIKEVVDYVEYISAQVSNEYLGS